MNHQSEFPAFATARDDADGSEKLHPKTLAVCRYLKAANGWASAVDVADAIGINRRAVRLTAEDARGLIIGNTTGYKLLSMATTAELFAARKRLEKQADRMKLRGEWYLQLTYSPETRTPWMREFFQ